MVSALLDYDELCTPEFGEVPSIKVYQDCIQGTCDCIHYVGDVSAQLKPCRGAQFLFGSSALDSILGSDRHYLWHGLVNGFKIVDPDCPAAYNCRNHDSITGEEFREEMSTLLQGELSAHKVSRVDVPPPPPPVHTCPRSGQEIGWSFTTHQ